jgi:hypothetical protein
MALNKCVSNKWVKNMSLSSVYKSRMWYQGNSFNNYHDFRVVKIRNGLLRYQQLKCNRKIFVILTSDKFTKTSKATVIFCLHL